jgi:hypothetical protein
LHPADEDVTLKVLRGLQQLSVVVPAMQHKDALFGLADFIDPRNLIEGLGVFLINPDDRLRSPLYSPRYASGLMVIARSPGANDYTSDLRQGDILYNVNQQRVESVQQVRSLLQQMKPRQPVVLQIERNSQLQYIAFEWGD